MPALRSPEDILTTELKEIHSAERQLSRLIPRLAKKVTSERFKELLDERVEQGSTLIERIEQAFERMEVGKGRAKNVAAEGLMEDATDHLEQVEDERLLEPVLLASVQKIEHYCIAAWGTAASLGRLLEQKVVVDAMEQALKDGKRLDAELTKLAEDEINPQMLEGAEDDESEDADAEAEDGGASGGSRRRGGSRAKRARGR
jgi:ferritin-like metal-binding protein YciE